MTPSMWIDAIHKLVMLLGLGFVVWWVWHAGGNSIKVADMQAVQKQTADIAKSFSEWQSQDTKAKKDQADAIKALNDRIAQQHAPIIVRVPAPAASSIALPGVPAGGNAGPASAGRSSAGSGESREEDLRPEFNRLESKYSEALAKCRRVISTCKVPR